MTNSLDIARNTLLAPAELKETDLDQVMEQLLSTQIDIADIYFEASRLESWVLEEGIIREGAHSIEQGVGVRAVSGEKTGFAYTDEIHLSSLLEAGRTARAIASLGQHRQAKMQRLSPGQNLYPAINPLETLTESEKIELLRTLDNEARRLDPRVTQVNASLVAVQDIMLIASSDGTLAADVRPLIRCNVHVIVEQNGRREQGSSGGGARQPLQFLLQEQRALGYAREAVR